MRFILILKEKNHLNILYDYLSPKDKFSLSNINPKTKIAS